MYVRIIPKKRPLRWTTYAKLAPLFCGPFQIFERIGPVAYRLALPSHIHVHNMFHVYVLKRYVHDPKHIIDWKNVQVSNNC